MSFIYRAPSGPAFATRDELDAAYDVEASVEDFGIYVDFFVGESERTRASRTHRAGVHYGPHRDETLDIFFGTPGGPIVVFLHGGYWKSLTSSEFSFVADGLVQRGATVIIPNYSLLPHVSIDEIVRQSRAALAWTHSHADVHGGDPGRIVLVGHSAGAHLSAMLLTTNWLEEYGIPEPVVAACAISGLYDLRPLYFTSMQTDFLFTGEQILRNSPLLGPPLTAPPLLVTHGTEQPSEFTRQSRDFHAAWSGAGLPCEYWPREGNHFNELEAFIDPRSELVSRILGFVE